MDQLLCPKCHNIMARYERNGVHVDGCEGCGGLFLDRGELEHLIQAEAVYYGRSAPQAEYRPAPAPSHGAGYGPGPGYRDGYRDDRGYQQQPRKKKARGFLEDLLDF